MKKNDIKINAQKIALETIKIIKDEKKNILTEKELGELVKKVASKTIGYDIDPVKYEEIPNKLSKILSKCLKTNVEVSGNELDGKDIIVKVEKHKND